MYHGRKVQSLNKYSIILFISKCKDIDKFILRRQSVSIMLLLRIRSGDYLRIERLMFVTGILKERLSQLGREVREILLLRRM